MELVEITEEHKSEYQNFVHANGLFQQDWIWGDFRKKLGFEIFRYALRENGEIMFSAQFSKNKFRGKAYLFAEYGLVAGQHLKTNAREFEKYLNFFFAGMRAKFPKIIFFRIEPSFVPAQEAAAQALHLPNLVKTIDHNPHQTLILNLELSSQQLLDQMHQKTRYNIKLAQRDGVEVKCENNFSQVMLPFAETARRSHIRLFTTDYYEKLLSFFSDTEASITAKVYTAWHENDLLATNIMLYYDKRTAIYLFGGTSSIKRNLMGPHALQWQAIQDAREAGFKIYDFYGIELNPKHPWFGFSRFKAGFGGEVVPYMGTHDFMFSRAWYNIYKGLRKLNRAIHP